MFTGEGRVRPLRGSCTEDAYSSKEGRRGTCRRKRGVYKDRHGLFTRITWNLQKTTRIPWKKWIPQRTKQISWRTKQRPLSSELCERNEVPNSREMHLFQMQYQPLKLDKYTDRTKEAEVKRRSFDRSGMSSRQLELKKSSVSLHFPFSGNTLQHGVSESFQSYLIVDWALEKYLY